MTLRDWLQCERCELCKGRKRVVLGEGACPADLLMIGEAPGPVEDTVGKPFFGRSGRLLGLAIQKAAELRALDAGLDRSRARAPSYYITNTVACHPPINRDPRPEEAWACWPRLREEADLVEPARVILLGKVAQTFCSAPWPEAVCLPHPAYILRRGGTQSTEYREFVAALIDTFKEIEA